MSILVTGATGYIGQNLVSKLVESGHHVHALYRSPEQLHLLKHPNIKLFKGNILDTDSLEKAMQSCKYVYHVAAFARTWAKDPQTYFDINLHGTLNVFEKALQAGVKRVVFTSTAGVLGPSTDVPINEAMPRESDFLNEYESSKYMAEEEGKAYVKKGLEVVTVNPPRVYGPGIDTPSNPLTKMIRLYLKGKWHIIPGDGSKTGSYVYIDDIVNGHILAMEKGRPGERYILGGINASFNEFFHTLKHISQKNHSLYKLPVGLMVVSSSLMLLWTKISGRPPLITPKWVRKYNYNWSLSSQKAIDELGYQITPLEEGIRKTIEWIKEKEVND